MAKTNKQAHRIKSVKPNTRLTDYAAQVFPILGSRTAAKKAIAAGTLLVNDELSEEGAFVKKGDVLILKIKAAKKPKVHIDLPVVFEDDYLMVINKPAGIAVNGNRNKTVENAVIAIAKKSYEVDALPSPVAVHRIDVPTKGLVLLAKTKTALIQLSKAFQNNQVKKTYWAIVHGKPASKGRIDKALQGKNAITDFERVKVVSSRVFNHLSLVKLSPVTGRTHQLRIHLNDAGHLIMGDKQYAGRTKTVLGKGLFLAACQLIFTHPITGKTIDLEIQPPIRFKKFLEREQKRF